MKKILRKTATLRDTLFMEHDPGFGHPESPQRLKVINDVLEREEFENFFINPPIKPAPRAVIALNHDKALINRVEETAGNTFDSLDSDTTTSPQSCAAATLAVGALTTGVDLLIKGSIDNAFSLVRPPGHHAERNKSMGFCLYNNVAVAARYAISHHGLKRVMIVDWDVHHGNGTQESFYETDKVLYVSTHQFPFYPGSGNTMETGRGRGEGYTVNIPLPGYQGDADYATIFNKIIKPIGSEYKPELILVSCGFDIYKDDPLGSMEVTAEGFAYLTRSMVQLAEEVCDGKLMLTLEGGYDFTGQRDGALAVLSELSGRSLDVGFSINFNVNAVDKLAGAHSVHPAINQAEEVAKKSWKL